MAKRIGVLGGGAWGTALATMLSANGHSVIQWMRDQDTVKSINESRKNAKYLPGIDLCEKLEATGDFKRALHTDILLAVTPAQSFARLCEEMAGSVSKSASVVLCAKGIDRQSGKLLSDIATKQLHDNHVAVLSGPSFAVDVATGKPTAVTLAADTIEHASELSKALSTPTFRIYASDDVRGAELGGALKNVMALAVGAARGLALGASAEAALIARGFAEINRLAVALGARAETLSGLSGLGDLVLTCSSPQSRNFSYGVALARAEDLTNLPLAEGAFTAEIAARIARQNQVDTPIIDAITEVLGKRISVDDAVAQLLSRPLKAEINSS
ncbi:MAG: NAD(P)H-dependent glycerol-3-phosphate dehydrogenase [Pseudomonadota bacterium]